MTPLSTNPTLNGSVNLTGVTNATADQSGRHRHGADHCLRHHGRSYRFRHIQHAVRIHNSGHSFLTTCRSQAASARWAM